MRAPAFDIDEQIVERVEIGFANRPKVDRLTFEHASG
jgi:hypothetical protein